MTAAIHCEKQPARGARGIVCTNHPLASAAGAEILLAGGNAVDAAIAALFTLTVVEPMMVGLLGGGISHLRLADGRHLVVDGLSTAPASATPGMYRCRADTPPEEREVEGRQNALGPRAVAVPAALPAWAHILATCGTLSLADAMSAAIRHASDGFAVTPYLSDCIGDAAGDLARDADLAARFLPDGLPLRPGVRLRTPAYADTLRHVAQVGARALHGDLGRRVADFIGHVTIDDLRGVTPIERAPIHGHYRGYQVFGPPPPASSGVHIAQMLNLLSGFDVARMGFATPDGAHLIAEVLKIAFADRAVATADPAFVDVPVARLTSQAYADKRAEKIDLRHAQAWTADPVLTESRDTTHVTVADAAGNVVVMTQTINALFGARIAIPGTGLIANNYMHNFDPRPGHALSIAPGKRVFTSMAPMIALRAGRPAFALGLPGGLKIFPSALQAIVNIIDHGMDLQEAVEAPRIWTQGLALEVEPGIPEATVTALIERGHDVKRVRTIGGGMNGVSFDSDGLMTGAACWRADGSVAALGGGLARAGVRFTLQA